MVLILAKRLKSIFTDDMDRCMYTWSFAVERHHIFHNTHGERMLCEKYGFIAPLRWDLHQNGKDSVHQNPNGKIDLELKKCASSIMKNILELAKILFVNSIETIYSLMI